LHERADGAVIEEAIERRRVLHLDAVDALHLIRVR
jgi:hypothetical protein